MNADQEHKVRVANWPRYERLDTERLRDVVAYLNGADPQFLAAILADLEGDWA